ncbi:MAG: 4Fe-4S binding protein [Firmicutes bacterium]|nr:4Fe-4S binding protein [Bacillota bacterium]
MNYIESATTITTQGCFLGSISPCEFESPTIRKEASFKSEGINTSDACPMNTVMIPVEWLSKKLNLQTGNTPNWLKKGVFPWIALGISIVVMVLSKRALHVNLPALFIWLALSMLVTLRYKPEVFHNYICPFGVLQKVFGRAVISSKKVDAELCIGCKKCEKGCPSLVIVVNGENPKAVISNPLCHQCNNCSAVCPVSAI